MKNNTSDLLLKFKHGDKLSDMELQQLSEGLNNIYESLKGAGIMFKMCADFTLRNLQSVNGVILAREGA